MCHETAHLRLRIAACFEPTRGQEWRTLAIDGCIGSLVEALQAAGIDMLGSCCGHEKWEGYIHLADGRALLVLDQEQAEWYFTKGIPLMRRSRLPERAV
ncbi:MAG TPA: hypothetical protein VF530_12455 [Planctomycetota bacterium]